MKVTKEQIDPGSRKLNSEDPRRLASRCRSIRPTQMRDIQPTIPSGSNSAAGIEEPPSKPGEPGPSEDVTGHTS